MLKRIALAVFVLSIGSSCCISSSSSSTSSSLTKRGRIRIRDGGVSAAGFVMLRAAGHDRGKVQRRSTYGSSHVGGSMKEGTEGAATRSRRRRVSMAVGEGGGGGGRDKERGSIHNNNKKTRRGGGAVLSCSSNNHNHQEKAMGTLSRLIQSFTTSPATIRRAKGVLPKEGLELQLGSGRGSPGGAGGPSKDPSPFSKWWEGLELQQQIKVYKGMLASVAVVYGTNFGAIKYLDEANIDVSIVTAVRFFLAALCLWPFLLKAPKEVWTRGGEVGLWVSIGYITQAIGLQTTQASKSAFICSLSVIVVPIINGLIYNKKIPITTWLASLCAAVGVGLLTLEGAQGPVIGDLWSLGQPLGFGMAFVRTEQCMREYEDQALAVTAAQMISVFCCSLCWVSFVLTAKQPDYSILWEPIHFAALLYTGLITSAMAVVIESLALAYVPAEETTVILSTEPIWAAAFGAVVLGESLNGWGYLGAAIIVGGILLTQVRVPKEIEDKINGFLGRTGYDYYENEEEEGSR